MANCEKFESCSFFRDKMREMPSIAELFRSRFCMGDKSECARYYIFRVLDNMNFTVSSNLESRISRALPTLFPNELDRAKKLFRQTAVK